MSGIQEILVILGVIFLLLFLPRSIPGNRPADRKKKTPPLKKMNGMLRLGILISLFWLTAAALWLRPWGAHLAVFVAAGAGPVAAGWGLWWVLAGFRKNSSGRLGQ